MWTNVYLQLKALTTCTRRWSRMLVEDAFRWLDWFSGCVCFVGRDYYYYPSVLCWVLVRDEAEVALECMTLNPVLSNRRVCFKRFSVLTLLLQHAGQLVNSVLHGLLVEGGGGSGRDGDDVAHANHR